MAFSEMPDLQERIASIEPAIEYETQAQVNPKSRFDGLRRRLTASCSRSSQWARRSSQR